MWSAQPLGLQCNLAGKHPKSRKREVEWTVQELHPRANGLQIPWTGLPDRPILPTAAVDDVPQFVYK